MNLVLDCSFIMSHILPHETNNSIEICNEIANNTYCIYVPSIFYLECHNVLSKALYKDKKISIDGYNAYIDGLMRLDVKVDHFSSTPESMYVIKKLISEYNISPYDASYLELALRLEARIATLDNKLKNTCIKAKVQMY